MKPPHREGRRDPGRAEERRCSFQASFDRLPYECLDLSLDYGLQKQGRLAAADRPSSGIAAGAFGPTAGSSVRDGLSGRSAAPCGGDCLVRAGGDPVLKSAQLVGTTSGVILVHPLGRVLYRLFQPIEGARPKWGDFRSRRTLHGDSCQVEEHFEGKANTIPG